MPKLKERLIVRDYRASDMPGVLALHKLALQATNAWAKKGRWDEDLKDIGGVYLKGGAFIIGEIDGRMVAMGALRRVSDSTAEIKRMRVHPDLQGRGYGQLLLGLLESRARNMGFSRIVLDTTVRQTAAIGLYLKNGYRETRREHIGTENIDTDLMHYEKRL